MQCISKMPVRSTCLAKQWCAFPLEGSSILVSGTSERMTGEPRPHYSEIPGVMQQSKVCRAQDVMSLDYSGSSSLPMAFTRASSAGECVGDKTLGTEVEHAMVRTVERPLAAMKALGYYSAGGNTSICSSLTKYRLLPCLLLLPRPGPWGLVPVCRRSARYKRSRLSLHTPRTRPGSDLVLAIAEG